MHCTATETRPFATPDFFGTFRSLFAHVPKRVQFIGTAAQSCPLKIWGRERADFGRGGSHHSPLSNIY